MSNSVRKTAFQAFRSGDLSQLKFIPNIQELQDDFTKDLAKSCCKARRRVIMKYRQLFFKAFSEANQ